MLKSKTSFENSITLFIPTTKEERWSKGDHYLSMEVDHIIKTNSFVSTITI
jgi:hypothetical protein